MECYALKNVSFSYPESKEKVIDGLSLNIEQGAFFVLFGVSGCGKSTLLRLLKSELAPHGAFAGEIKYYGNYLSDIDARTQASKIGFVSQSPDNQIVCDKVWHELAFGAESLGMEQKAIRSRVAEVSSFFGIENWFYRDVKDLSGGQKQLLALASIMVMNPEVLILDEPTSQLDPIAASEFLSTLAKINRELGTTVIIAEHRLEEAVTYASEIAVMENGSILSHGSPETVAREIRDNVMFPALPAYMRLWAELGDGKGSCPNNVKEGKVFLEQYFRTRTVCEYHRERETIAESVLSAKSVHFRYEKEGNDVLNDFSLTVHRGEIFALVGGNGTGKSTALKVLAGVCKAQSGEIERKGKMALLPQNPRGLFVKKTVSEDLKSICTDWNLLQEVCRMCNIEHLMKLHPFDLSGGELQRVGLAKILLLKPDILLLDEPTKGMDAAFKKEFADILFDLAENGYSVLMVSHDTAFCAEYADTVGIFFDGMITAAGSPEEIFSNNFFYTTAVSKMSKNVLPEAVSVDDVMKALGRERENGRRLVRKAVGTETESKAVEEGAKKLPLYRKIIAAVFAITSAAVFLYATSITDLTKLISAEGVSQEGRKEFVIYGIFIGALLGFILSIARKSDKSIADQMSKDKRKLSKRTVVSCFLILLVIPLTLYCGIFYFGNSSYGIVSIVVLIECMLPFFIIFEGRKPKAREIVIISVLCGLGIAGRAAFFMLPQFKPVMAITIVAGIAFGAESGFMVGAVTMLASNMLFSQGPWTPWQMFAMGIIGFLAGILFKKGLLRRNKMSICSFGALSAMMLYGGIMNPASVLIWTPASWGWESLLASYLSGFPMDLIHALATAIFLYFLAEPMLEKLDRIKIKYDLVRY